MPITPKLTKRYGLPKRIVEKTPEIEKKAAQFLKAGSKMIDVSKIREANSAIPDLEKRKEFLQKYKGKHILKISAFGKTSQPLPDIDAVSLFVAEFMFDNLGKNNKTIYDKIDRNEIKNSGSDVLFVIDENGKNIGRVHMHITPKTLDVLEEYRSMTMPLTKDNISEYIRYNRFKIAEEEVKGKEKAGKNLTDKNRNFILYKATKYYYEKELGLHLEFKAMPGYRYNQKTLEFEKI